MLKQIAYNYKNFSKVKTKQSSVLKISSVSCNSNSSILATLVK